MKIVVGVDGSDESLRAVAWCATYAKALGAEVIAVHAIELPIYPSTAGFFPMPVYEPPDREKLEQLMIEQWCAALKAAGVPVRPVVTEGYPANVIRETADAQDADLVVVGRRGLGGFTELVLGSTSHHLAHHLSRPIVIVP